MDTPPPVPADCAQALPSYRHTPEAPDCVASVALASTAVVSAPQMPRNGVPAVETVSVLAHTSARLTPVVTTFTKA